ncbi:MAG TPA: alkyl sulfatase C-terminal domain-containing protein, partial [Solirubrobacteraceae bacterium]|nr:alkyl sulfatase C-terminal domain-containing protein [Solirubrobacteraceae bacterium]
DSVADNLSPYIDAAPLVEQKYFLTTQQVDEARHAVFFGRFMREVVETGGDDLAGTLEATRPELTWGFRKVFERLDKMADELRRDRSRPQLAAAVTLYHIVIEAGLAQAGQHFITNYLHERQLLPGFTEGMDNITQDEQRHIGFGVKLLADLVKEDPDCRYAVADLLREVLPWTASVLAPPGWDRRYTECFGSTLEEIGAEGSRSLETKLRSAGLALETLPGAPPLPLHVSPEERARRGIALVEAGMLGEKNGPASRDPEIVAMLFDTIAHSVDKDAAPPQPTTIQWDFSDHEPWFLRIDNGATSAVQGRLEHPDVTLRTRFEDFVDVTAGRADPLRLLARGRLRLRGRPRTLWRMRAVFPR